MIKRVPIIISVFAILVAVGALVYNRMNQPKIAFVLVTDLFNGFEMKKEMEIKFKKTVNERKKILDSLEIDISVLAHRLEESDKNKEAAFLFERKRVEYQQKRQMFEEDNASLSKQYDEQIVKQLNQYVADFGEAHNYDIIYGNTTNGSIMFAKESYNCTREAITYINNKYKGLK